MEEGHEGNRHSTQVASTLVERKLSGKNNLAISNSSNLSNDESYDLGFLNSSSDGLVEGYGSDSEGSSNGSTDRETICK